MGELLDQMTGGGPGLVPLADVVGGMIPGLADDLATGADPVAASRALKTCAARRIPEPHRRYGHLLFGVGGYRAGETREDAIRAIADVCAAAHKAPAFGSSLGDVPASSVGAALRAHGFPCTADAWLSALAVGRSKEAARVERALVWEVPESLLDPRHLDIAQRCVGIHDGRYVAVDLASFGERVTDSSPLWANFPEVPHRVTDFERTFCDRFEIDRRMSARGIVAMTEILTRHCGAPRAPRIFGVSE